METPVRSTTLALDLGNSFAKAAVFVGGALAGPIVRFEYPNWEVADGLVTNHGVENIVYSSVANVPPRELMDKWTKAQRRVISLQAGNPLPFPSRYATPETLGQDRIAAVLGCLASFPPNTAPATTPTPARDSGAKLIVDAGTCVTTDLLDGTGTHLGGNISPGVRMRLRAMHEFTAKLPEPEPAAVEGAVGSTTVSALRHGAQLGLVYELEGLYFRLLPAHPGLELVLTGGDGEWLAEKLSVPCSLRPDLVLRGLLQLTSIYVRNES
ncbi:type III pantothenate kinase [Neolewinella antarctica]|uniref:Type III pantothenate kinase n=1 Tax=Neolewinella antarctica TaxID=442734 RepID=A0ABX0XC72_9BACT|nr:type III pantothenate kinase [Neolewinella antarctica]NJC26571.1 type III pantothenate kinase [Neolewinella antarctica]